MMNLRNLPLYSLLYCAGSLVACGDSGEGGNEPNDPPAYVACEAADETIEFESDNLANKVRAELGVSARAITCGDMATLEELDATGLQIDSLVGIEHAVELRTLVLNSNAIRDLEPLSGLKKLNTLYLSQNEVSDIAPLEPVTTLVTLALDGNRITNLASLSALISLEALGLSGQQPTGADKLDDLSPLKTLSSLKHLGLDGNDLVDVSDLKTLYSLETLSLHNNDISDISPLGSLPSLTTLVLSRNQIETIVSLGFLQNLEELRLDENLITNDALDEMAPLKELQYLNLAQNELTSLQGLQSFEALITLIANENQIENVVGINHISDVLNAVSLKQNQIADIGPLTFVTDLVDLQLTGNQIEEIDALRNLEHLKNIYLEDNLIKDIEAIVDNANNFPSKALGYVMLDQNCLDTSSGSLTSDHITELYTHQAYVSVDDQKNCAP